MTKKTSTKPKPQQKQASVNVPDNFISIIADFANDLSVSFSEYDFLWAKWKNPAEISEQDVRELYVYCTQIYPERFFDILYQNDEIFLPTNKTNTMFLPNVEFKALFGCEGVSDSIKNTMWKYIQLILFTIVGNIKDKTDFGESMNMFQGIDEKELQEKLTEAMGNIGDFFKDMDNTKPASDGVKESTGDNAADFEKMSSMFDKMMDDMSSEENASEAKASEENASNPKMPSFMPNPEDLHNHLKGLFDGKLGMLANELMEELTEELKESLDMDDLENSKSTKDIFQKLMKNPVKFMNIVKKISQKFQDKISRGDISQEEIMKEAGEMLKKMKEMGGNSKQMQEMFQNIAKSMGGMSGLGKGAKIDTNALNRMVAKQTTRERMLAKLEQKRQEKFELEQKSANHLVYRPTDGEKQEKSSVRPAPIEEDLDALVAQIEGTGKGSSIIEPSAKEKKKKNKKNK